MKSWDYNEAFSRNRGLISVDEQEKLRNSRVAIAGMGGVGGVDLVALARLGIGKFTIADADIFEVSNFNRQYGATLSSVGQAKVEVMRKLILDINPLADIRVYQEFIDEKNVDDFLKGADLFVDGIDAFVIKPRRLLYKKAREKGIYSINAGPLGCSTGFLIFDPKGMSCDDYFDFSDDMNETEMFINFILGVAPASLHRVYMDLKHVDIEKHIGPSVSAACQLCAGVVVVTAVKILLQRGSVHSVPYYHQFDAYREIYVCKKLVGGNRNLLQRIKKWFLKKRLKQLGVYHA